MIQLTGEQFYEKYGSVEVQFSHYNYFTFHFVGKLPNGNTIWLEQGGNPDDIANFPVSATHVYKIHDELWNKAKIENHQFKVIEIYKRKN